MYKSLEPRAQHQRRARMYRTTNYDIRNRELSVVSGVRSPPTTLRAAVAGLADPWRLAQRDAETDDGLWEHGP